MEAIMRNLATIMGASVLISTVGGCAYYEHSYAYPDGYYSRPVYYSYEYRPYGYRYYDYSFSDR